MIYELAVHVPSKQGSSKRTWWHRGPGVVVESGDEIFGYMRELEVS